MNTIKFTSSGISSEYQSYGSMSEKKIIVYDSRPIDLSVVDGFGNLIFPPLRYDSTSGNTEIDLSQWIIDGEWEIQKNVVQKGYDAKHPVNENDMFLITLMSSMKNSYAPLRKFKRPIPMKNILDVPVVGKRFYASGFSQLENGKSIVVTIPAFGENRQYLETTRIVKSCLHHFQVEHNGEKILEAILDSNDFNENGKNLGQIYYFPENLTSYDESGNRKLYNWRYRISYKRVIEGSTEHWPENLQWSEWSQYFTFKVNSAPGSPTELSVSSK